MQAARDRSQQLETDHSRFLLTLLEGNFIFFNCHS